MTINSTAVNITVRWLCGFCWSLTFAAAIRAKIDDVFRQHHYLLLFTIFVDFLYFSIEWLLQFSTNELMNWKETVGRCSVLRTENLLIFMISIRSLVCLLVLIQALHRYYLITRKNQPNLVSWLMFVVGVAISVGYFGTSDFNVSSNRRLIYFTIYELTVLLGSCVLGFLLGHCAIRRMCSDIQLNCSIMHIRATFYLQPIFPLLSLVVPRLVFILSIDSGSLMTVVLNFTSILIVPLNAISRLLFIAPYRRINSPGERCENGGQYLGWSCVQAVGCQFGTPSGVLQGACVNGVCCTIRTPRSQCPSSLRRSRRRCLQNSECTTRVNNRLLIGECHDSRCCLPRTNRKKRSICRRGELRTTTSCSSTQPCPFQEQGRIAACRNGRCCLRPSTQPANQCPINTQPIGACGVGNSRCTLWINNSWVQGQCCNHVCCARIYG